MWYVWHACRKKQRDILSVVIVLAIPRPLDYAWLFVSCSAISAMWALAWGLVCKELHMLELHFFFSVPPFSRCTERINGMASGFISPFLLCVVFHTHVDTCGAEYRVTPEGSPFSYQLLQSFSFLFFFFFFFFFLTMTSLSDIS